MTKIRSAISGMRNVTEMTNDVFKTNMTYFTTSLATTVEYIITTVATEASSIDNANVTISDNISNIRWNTSGSATEHNISDEYWERFSPSWLNIIHISAITCLFTSACFSSGILVHSLILLPRTFKTPTPFWERKIPDRFVVYLAFSDLIWE